MKSAADSIEHFKKVLSLALDVDDAFDAASHEKCTCGSDPEGPCGFCSKWARGLGMTRFMTTITDNEQWVMERCECSEGRTCLICATERAVAEASDLDPPPQTTNQTPYIIAAFIAALLLHAALLIVVNL